RCSASFLLLGTDGIFVFKEHLLLRHPCDIEFLGVMLALLRNNVDDIGFILLLAPKLLYARYPQSDQTGDTRRNGSDAETYGTRELIRSVVVFGARRASGLFPPLHLRPQFIPLCSSVCR
ncbi:hypothetical protein HY213_00690, partial [Candidatus Peregrinibacteria bacterium]|nr:hypothetical protein [Candidatus Peregrinibacteria bacterium]